MSAAPRCLPKGGSTARSSSASVLYEIRMNASWSPRRTLTPTSGSPRAPSTGGGSLPVRRERSICRVVLRQKRNESSGVRIRGWPWVPGRTPTAARPVGAIACVARAPSHAHHGSRTRVHVPRRRSEHHFLLQREEEPGRGPERTDSYGKLLQSPQLCTAITLSHRALTAHKGRYWVGGSVAVAALHPHPQPFVCSKPVVVVG